MRYGDAAAEVGVHDDGWGLRRQRRGVSRAGGLRAASLNLLSVEASRAGCVLLNAIDLQERRRRVRIRAARRKAGRPRQEPPSAQRDERAWVSTIASNALSSSSGAAAHSGSTASSTLATHSTVDRQCSAGCLLMR